MTAPKTNRIPTMANIREPSLGFRMPETRRPAARALKSAAEQETPPESLPPCIGGRSPLLHLQKRKKDSGRTPCLVGKLEHS